MQLTQLATIKARLGIDKADITDDAVLTAALVGLSARITNDCNRNFDYQAAATFNFRAHEMDLRVDRYPIASVASFATKDTEALGWVAVAAPDVPDYLIGPAGNIIELAAPLGSSRQLAQVTYAGGYALPGAAVAGVPNVPDDLEQAVVEQVCWWYQRRQQLGVQSISGDGGTVSFFRSLDLLPTVVPVVLKYERLML